MRYASCSAASWRSSAREQRRSQTTAGSSEIETRFAQASSRSKSCAFCSSVNVTGREAPAFSKASTIGCADSRWRISLRSLSRESQGSSKGSRRRASCTWTRSRRSGTAISLLAAAASAFAGLDAYDMRESNELLLPTVELDPTTLVGPADTVDDGGDRGGIVGLGLHLLGPAVGGPDPDAHGPEFK